MAIGIEQGLNTDGISDEVLSRYRAQLLTFMDFDFRTAILEEDYSPQLKVLLLDIMLTVPPILRVHGLSDACAGVLTEIGGVRSAELVKKYSDKISDAYIGYFIAHNPEEAQVVGLS